MSETTAPKITLNKSYTLTFALWSAALFVIWGTYNSYVPLIFQAGNPGFNMPGAAVATGFGLGAFVTGLLMSMDNFSMVILQPILGNFTDRVKRRKPYVVIGGALTAIFYGLIPFGFLNIAPENSGNAGALMPLLLLTIIAALGMIVSWSFALPAEAGLKFTIIPSAARTRVWSIVAFIGGIAFVATFMTSNMLYSIHPGLPFWVGSGFLLLVVLLYAILVKEPENTVIEKEEGDEVSGLGALFSGLKLYERADLIAMLTVAFTKFAAIFGVAALETFGSSYLVTVLGVPANNAAMYLAIYFVGYLVAAIPVGYLSNRFGRKNILRIALLIFVLIGVVQFSLNSMSLLIVVLLLAGAANGTTDVMILPMGTDLAPSKKVMGVTVGIMSAITTLASIISVPFWGAVIDATGGNFRVIWIALIVGPLLSFALTFQLKGNAGEAKPVTVEETKW